jgi:transposase
MNHVTEIGNTLVVSKEFFSSYTHQVAELASQKAIEQYRIERSKDEKVTVSEVAKQEKCTPPTVIEWINRGVKKGKIKLKASRKGTRDYIISRYDLNQFLEAKNI